MRLFGKTSKNKAQISPSSDNLSFDDTSSPFSSSDYDQQVPFSGSDKDNSYVNGTEQRFADTTRNPSAKQGNRKHINSDQNSHKHGEAASAPVNKSLVVLLVVVVIIAGMVIFSHQSHHSSNSNSDDYSSYMDSRQKKLDEQKKKSDIVENASNVYTKEISDPESQVVEAVYPIIESVGINGESRTVNQADLDKLKSAMTKFENSGNAFTKTQAYRQSRDVRKAYKSYQDKKKDYIDVLNNFADAATGYAATAKNCQENTMDLPIMGEDPNYLANTQTLITNCLTSAQSIAKSKDPIIKKYAQSAIDHMGVAQQQLDGIKALGSPDDIYGDETKFHDYSSMEGKLSNNLYTAEQYGKQNPLYNKLTNARPDKEMNDLYTSMDSIAE
ncbi:hypothetical protein OZX67_08025 [Bifidobacterium sp. ESL0728]|uniref:hypothetical protein n=1 Tax=Bifidobacterium sp. ESL0728 TaxID=2983220 RepID=UPI0023F87F2C|nr:hypothetical protein [Bifidobacterium sp. ESL0728]WEV58731.1 hypothetical protein OZX67_08025 [Bifidobacterium sp. ESL0728]